MTKIFRTLLFCSLAGIVACAPSTVVKPLKKNERVLAAHLGGPLITFSGLPMPVPLSGVEYHQGMSDRLSLGAGLALTALSFGNAQINLSATAGLIPEDNKLKTGLSAFAKTHFIFESWQNNFRFYPETGFHLYRQTGNQRWYAGGSAWFETIYGERKRSSSNIWVPMLHAGWQKAEGSWRPSVEIKWIAPSQQSDNLVVEYIGPAGKGSFGLYFGITKSF
jgi:hypothetical protein